MPITFLSFVIAGENYLIKLLRENNKEITDRVVRDYFAYLMGGFYTEPTQKQEYAIRLHANILILTGRV